MRIRLHLKIFLFIAIFIITGQIEIYGLLMLFTTLHEIGHMVTGVFLGFKPNKIDILPYGLSISFEENVDNYRKKTGKLDLILFKKIIIALNGPLTNTFFIILFYIFPIDIFDIARENIIYANILIGTFNLLPIYPLDGGRILKYILQIICKNEKSNNYIYDISYIVTAILTAISSIAILYLKNIAILIIIFYLWYLVFKNREKRCVENRGILTNT